MPSQPASLIIHPAGKKKKTKAQGWGTLAHNHPCVCTRHMKAAHLYFFYMNAWGVEGGSDEVFVRVFCGPTQQGIRERWWRRHTGRPPPLLRLCRLTPPFLKPLFPCSACSTESFIHEWLEASEPEDIFISSKWAFIVWHFLHRGLIRQRWGCIRSHMWMNYMGEKHVQVIFDSKIKRK